MFKFRSARGFSALELLVVIAILAILVGVTVIPLMSLRRRQLLVGTTEQVIGLITEARSRTLAAQNGANHGVLLTTNQLILFEGASAPGTMLETLDLSGVSLSGINLSGGGSVIIFDKLTGKSDQSGTLILSLDSDISQTKTIQLENTGVVYLLP